MRRRSRFNRDCRTNPSAKKSVCICTWSGAPRSRAMSHAISPVSNGSCAVTTSGLANRNEIQSASNPYKNRDHEFVEHTVPFSANNSGPVPVNGENTITSSASKHAAYAAMRLVTALSGFNIFRSVLIFNIRINIKDGPL